MRRADVTQPTTAPDQVNRDTWQVDRTLTWFTTLSGWSDPGERAAFEYLASDCAGVPILDIGVGAGRTVPLLRPLSEDYRALDFAPDMVEACRRAHPTVQVDVGDARDLSRYDDDSFGLVTFSWNGIDSVRHPDRQQVLAEVRRVLRPGGTFWFSTHNRRGPGFEEKPWTLRPDDVIHPRHLFDVVTGFPHNLRNHRRLRGLSEDGPGWAMRNAAAHHFGLVIHYTNLEAELAELADAGFRPNPVVFENRRGRMVGVGDDTRRTWWFHLLARA